MLNYAGANSLKWIFTTTNNQISLPSHPEMESETRLYHSYQSAQFLDHERHSKNRKTEITIYNKNMMLMKIFYYRVHSIKTFTSLN